MDGTTNTTLLSWIIQNQIVMMKALRDLCEDNKGKMVEFHAIVSSLTQQIDLCETTFLPPRQAID